MNEFDNKKNTNNKIPDYPQDYNCEPVDSSPKQTLAIISFILSLSGIFCCFSLLGAAFSIAAIVTGIISIRKNETRGFAISGIVIGVIGLIYTIVKTVVKILASIELLSLGADYLLQQI